MTRHVPHGWKPPAANRRAVAQAATLLPAGISLKTNNEERIGQLAAGQHQGIGIQEVVCDCFKENYLCKSLLHVNSVI